MTWPLTSRRIVLLAFVLPLALFCIWLGLTLKWIRDRKDVIEGNHYQGRVQVKLINPQDPPWSVGLLQGPGYESVVIYIKQEDQPTAEEQAAKQELEALFPEANVVYHSHLENEP